MTMSADGKSAKGDATDYQGRKFTVTASGNGKTAKAARPDGVDWTVPDRLADPVAAAGSHSRAQAAAATAGRSTRPTAPSS